MLHKLEIWHKTKLGLATFFLAELALAYGGASLAIDRGTWWWYLLTLVLFVGSLQNFAKLIRSFKHGHNQASRAR